MLQGKSVLEVSRVLNGIIGESVSFGASESYWDEKGLQKVGQLRAVVEIVKFKFSEDVRVRIIGKDINALWCPFSQRITGKGSKKFMDELSEVGRDAVAWFTSELAPTEPEQAPEEEESLSLDCPNCGTANAFPEEYAHRKTCTCCEENLHMIDGKMYHHTPKNKGTLSKEDLERVADGQTTRISGMTGGFIYDPGYRTHADLDGTAARHYLESRGFKVVKSGDTGYNGYALTADGIHLSTNGFLHRKREE